MAHRLLPLLALVLVPVLAPASGAEGPSLDASMTWLEEQVRLHGKMYGEDVGGSSRNPRWFVYRVNAWGREPCRMSVSLKVWDLDEGYRPTEPWWKKGAQSSTGSYALKDVRLDGVTVRRPSGPKYSVYGPGDRSPAECVVIPLRRDAMKLSGSLRPGSVFRYSVSEVCLTAPGLAERAAEAVRRMARSCGAGNTER